MDGGGGIVIGEEEEKGGREGGREGRCMMSISHGRQGEGEEGREGGVGEGMGRTRL
jgi:hypothetical protein